VDRFQFDLVTKILIAATGRRFGLRALAPPKELLVQS
jgi:hypothetical protein